MSGMDIFYFILVAVALGGILYLLHRSDVRTKNKYKLAAYKLLEEKNPDPKKVKDTLKMLHLYVGRFRKDHEFVQLQILLSDLLLEIDKPEKPNKKAKI
jgi:hypothetical protein